MKEYTVFIGIEQHDEDLARTSADDCGQIEIRDNMDYDLISDFEKEAAVEFADWLIDTAERMENAIDSLIEAYDGDISRAEAIRLLRKCTRLFRKVR
jgi:hypothetical protein